MKNRRNYVGNCGSKDDFEKAYPDETSLGRFIRSIAELDRNTAKTVFAKYLDDNKFNGNQITFINQIIDYLTQKGILDPSQLFEIPFDKEVIADVFKENEVDDIIDIIEGINLNAEVAV